MNFRILVPLAAISIAILVYLLTPTAALYQFILNTERSLAGLELKKIEIDQLEIEYLRGGKGPVLILLHGFGANKDNWNKLSGHLVEQFDVIAIDVPGFGNSTKDFELDYDVLSQVDRVKRFTEALNLDQFSLAGSSMGGYIAGNFAARYPLLVDNLWLISPFGVRTTQLSDMFAATKNGEQPAVLPRNETEFMNLFTFLFVEPPFIPSPILRHLASEAKASADLNSKIFQQIHRMKEGEPNPDMPLDSVLREYEGQVLITWGGKDRVLHVSGAKVLKKTLPHAELDINENVGHLPILEIPSKTAETFISFYKEF
ncbi:MAG: alpha/beta fold hydrolase [Alteromonadaceae bacterium]|nr:alpha/beta fold hydrolase [Alteromonadaceae bacterium]